MLLPAGNAWGSAEQPPQAASLISGGEEISLNRYASKSASLREDSCSSAGPIVPQVHGAVWGTARDHNLLPRVSLIGWGE